MLSQPNTNPRLSSVAQIVSQEIAGITFREPLVAGPSSDVELAWEGLMREVMTHIDEPRINQTLRQYSATPVSETLPHALLELAPESNHCFSRYAQVIAPFLRQPVLSPDLLTPDLSFAPETISRETARKKLLEAAENGTYEFTLQSVNEAVQVDGVTYEEKQATATRYRYARLTKILSLAAGLANKPPELHVLPDGSWYGSVDGIQIGLHAECREDRVALLNPRTWHYAKQIKDRVYEVGIASKRYILKERKTNRHTDVPYGGYVESNSVQEEYAIGCRLHEAFLYTDEDISLRWEKPVAFADFPDGFGCTIFEKIPKLETKFSTVFDDLVAAIQQHRSMYEEEWQETVRILAGEDLRHFGMQDTKGISINLTFEQFSRAKAGSYFDRTSELELKQMADLGFVNADTRGSTGFRVLQRNGRAHLRQIGFDSEYITYDPATARSKLRQLLDDKSSGVYLQAHILETVPAAAENLARAVLLQQYGFMIPKTPVA